MKGILIYKKITWISIFFKCWNFLCIKKWWEYKEKGKDLEILKSRENSFKKKSINYLHLLIIHKNFILYFLLLNNFQGKNIYQGQIQCKHVPLCQIPSLVYLNKGVVKWNSFLVFSDYLYYFVYYSLYHFLMYYILLIKLIK